MKTLAICTFLIVLLQYVSSYEMEFPTDTITTPTPPPTSDTTNLMLSPRLLLRPLQGELNENINAIDFVRSLLLRLELYHLEYEILQAKYMQKGVLFEMRSALEVQEILDALRKGNILVKEFEVLQTNYDFFEKYLEPRFGAVDIK